MQRLLRVSAVVVALAQPAISGEWRPAGLQPAAVSLAGVLAARERALGAPEPRERRERWTYVHGETRIPVGVAVRGDDVRATMRVAGATYEQGRLNGVRWRADANGVVHATWSDEQNDPLDRLPQSLFPVAAADCELAGETRGPNPEWVLVDRAVRDKPHWLFIDERSGDVVREMTRVGKRTVETTFSKFFSDPADGGARRPHAWHVADGDRADDLDVTVDAVAPGPVGEDDVALVEARRTFAAPETAGERIAVPASFRGARIDVTVGVAGKQRLFVLDSGTQGIELSAGATGGRVPVTLGHATISTLSVGALALADASVLVVPESFGADGILGADFFYGHVVHIDYARRTVEVMSRAAAADAFDRGKALVMPIDVDEGIPLLAGRIAGEPAPRIALDTGSAHPNVLAPFLDRYGAELARRSRAARFPGRRAASVRTDEYLEGSIVVTARDVGELDLGRVGFRDVVAGVQTANARADAMSLPLDAIVGTDQLRSLELWFDYDDGLLAVRRAQG